MQISNDIKSTFGQWTLEDVSLVASVSKEPTTSILHPENGGSSFSRNFSNTAPIYTVPPHKAMINIVL
jgi:hypothetical protein